MLGVVRRNPRFRRLWLAQLVSQAGSWFNRIAVLTLISSLGGELRGVGALYALELAIRLLPTALFTPLAGPIADRLPRRLCMVVADLLQALLVLSLLLVREQGQLPLLYALLFAQMSVGIFFEAARSASVPNTVPREELHEAYALSAVTWSSMLAAGAILGGAAVRFVGVHGVFLLDALTFTVSAALLLRLRLPPPPPQPAALNWKDVLFLRELRRGLDHVRSLSLLPALAAKTFWGAAGGYLVLLSIAGSERFGRAAAPAGEGPLNEEAAAAGVALATGALFFGRGLGTGLGPLLARRFLGESDRSLMRQITGSFLLAAASYACFGPTESLPWAVFFVTLAHMGGSTIWVSSTTLWQRHIDDAFRGRVFALEFLGLNLSFAAGGVLAGLLFDATGSIAQTTLCISGLVLLSGLVWTLMANRGRRESTLDPPAHSVSNVTHPPEETA